MGLIANMIARPLVTACYTGDDSDQREDGGKNEKRFGRFYLEEMGLARPHAIVGRPQLSGDGR